MGRKKQTDVEKPPEAETNHRGETNGTPEKKKPAQSYKLALGSCILDVAVWQNEINVDGEDRTLYSVSFTRSYKDGNDFRTNGSYRTAEIPALLYLLQLAHNWILGQRTRVGTDEPIPF